VLLATAIITKQQSDILQFLVLLAASEVIIVSSKVKQNIVSSEYENAHIINKNGAKTTDTNVSMSENSFGQRGSCELIWTPTRLSSQQGANFNNTR
jgi:hypothetical protein